MKPRIIKADSLGFCLGVRRAIETITVSARHLGGIETLGALVHNQQVLSRLESQGVKIVDDIASIAGDAVVISAHGVSPHVIEELNTRGMEVIDTTCPFVRRAQMAAHRLAEAGFFTLVFGDRDHPEVKGILGWAGQDGLAITEATELNEMAVLPLRLGIVSQTTQVPAAFNNFIKDVLDLALQRDAEIRIIDTLCHDIRRRQADTLRMAAECDLVLVIGGRTSANTRHLHELCSVSAETHLVETADEIDASWLKDKTCIGVTAGASTDDQTIDQVLARLENLVANLG